MFRHADDSEATFSPFARRVLLVAGVALLGLLVVLVVIYATDILFLLFAGLLFGCFLRGLAHAIAYRTALPYWVTLTAVLVLLTALVAGTTVYLVPQISDQFSQLGDELMAAREVVVEEVKENEYINKLTTAPQKLSQWLGSDFSVMSAIGGIFSTAVGALTGAVLILFIGIYFAAEPRLYERGILALVPAPRRDRAREALFAVEDTMWWWLIGRIVCMLVIGVLTTLGLWLLGIPMPVPLGLLAAVLTFIPNIGPVLALIPPTILALRQGPVIALGVIAFYVGVQLVESYVLTPLIDKRNLKIPPVLTLSGQAVLGYFSGILGLAVATPLAAVLMVLVRELYVRDVIEAREAQDAGAAAVAQ